MSEIVVLSNDVVPGTGLPVAAPGLRSWGIAEGLRCHGFDVTVAVDAEVVERAQRGPIPPPIDRHTLIMKPSDVPDLVRTRQAAALVITNSNHFDAIASLEDTTLVFDFFAPKVLEAAQLEGVSAEAVRALEARKLRALRRADIVAINGEKKFPYVAEWMRRAGRPMTASVAVPLITPMELSDPQPPDAPPVHVIVAGYLQPWSKPAAWTEALLPRIADGSVVLHLLLARHWGARRAETQTPDAFRDLLAMPGVVGHGISEYGDFRRLMGRCHLSIDVFEPNPERELAMVTRTLVALSCGVPVVHVPFTETGPLVAEYEAGWLVDGDDPGAVASVVDSILAAPETLGDRRANVMKLASSLLDPAAATRALAEALRAAA